MWQKALDRQYNLFGTVLIFLVTALTIVGAIIAGSDYKISICEKIIFSFASIILLVSNIGLLRMSYIERKVAFLAEPPKSSNNKLQKEENYWRILVYVSITLAVFLVLLLVNSIIWNSN